MKVTPKTGSRTALRAGALASAVGILVALAGCAPARRVAAWIPWLPRAHRTQPVAVQQPVRSPSSRGMVRAVGDSAGGGVPVEVLFKLRSRPLIGEPAQLDLEMVPSAPLDRLVASFHAESGLDLSHGAASTEAHHPQAGVPIDHVLTLVAQRDGIFYVNATVLVDSPNGSVARTFTIPIIAGDGMQ
jgi:hypothetical protein